LTQNKPTRAAERRRRQFHLCAADFPGRRAAAADPKPPARRRRLSDAGSWLYDQYVKFFLCDVHSVYANAYRAPYSKSIIDQFPTETSAIKVAPRLS